MVPAGTRVHDLAIVTSNDPTKTPTGGVSFSYFEGRGHCGGNPTKVEKKVLRGRDGVTTAESSNTSPLAKGDYSYQAKYVPNNAAKALGFSAQTSKCEPLRVN